MSSLASASVISLAPFDPSLSLSLLPMVGARLVKLPLLLLALSPFSFVSSLTVPEVRSLASFLSTRLCTLLKSEGRSVPPYPSSPERLPLVSPSSS